MNLIPGILLCLAVGSAAWGLGFFIPLGAATIAIFLGILLANTVKVPLSAAPGVNFTEKKILALAISLLGFSLDYKVLLSLGVIPLFLIILGVPVTILSAMGWGRLMGVEKDLALLIGTGNGICGSSAIGAAQGVLNAEEEHVGVSVGVINFLGTAGILLLPLLVSLFPGFSEQVKGMVIGNTLQAVGQVTAAGFSVGNEAGQAAAVVKMGRVLLISPVVLIYGLKRRKPAEEGGDAKMILPGIPPYILLFILFSLLNTSGIIPAAVTSAIREAGELLLITAMSGIGMKISIRSLGGEGKDALILGILTWSCQIGFTLLLIVLLRALGA